MGLSTLIKFKLVLVNRQFDTAVAYDYGHTAEQVINSFTEKNYNVAKNLTEFKSLDKYEYYIEKINLVELCNNNIMELPPDELVEFAKKKYDIDFDEVGWQYIIDNKIVCEHDNLTPVKNEFSFEPSEIELEPTDFKETFLNYCPICYKVFFKTNLSNKLEPIEPKKDICEELSEDIIENVVEEVIKEVVSEVIEEKESNNSNEEIVVKTIGEPNIFTDNIQVIAYKIEKVYTAKFGRGYTKEGAIEKMKKLIKRKTIKGRKVKYFQYIVHTKSGDQNDQS